MKPITAFKAAAYALIAFGGVYQSGMSEGDGWHVAPKVWVGAVVAAIVALRTFFDRSFSTDGKSSPPQTP